MARLCVACRSTSLVDARSLGRTTYFVSMVRRDRPMQPKELSLKSWKEFFFHYSLVGELGMCLQKEAKRP